jgi:hypothetical protein
LLAMWRAICAPMAPSPIIPVRFTLSCAIAASCRVSI